MRVDQLSEAQILARIVPILPKGDFTALGPGDDAAVVEAPGSQFVVTTDVLVEDVHFRRDWSSGFEVGVRAAAQNLSDVNAMGASATSVVVAMVLPGDLELSWLEDFASGLAAGLYPTGAGVVGGDLSIGEKLVISVTAHGTLAHRPLRRNGARPGDTVAIAGNLGQSAAGLAALQAGAVSGALRGLDVPYPFTRPVELYRIPEPPLEAGPLAASRGATAMMDLSDGLVRDAGRMAEASGVSIDLSRYGLQERAEELSAPARALGVDPYEWLLFGGEDHGLLVTFPPYVLVTNPFFPVGTVSEYSPELPERERARVTLDGRPVKGKGFDHFDR